jgi:hypothetical protein|nr:MAG TPA: Glycine rich protein family [Caudoviricetes sp.]
MKRNVIVFVICLLMLGAFMLGVKVGERRVIDNQVITDENNKEGFYYNGNEYQYWYE